jgi:hypothetical protein
VSNGIDASGEHCSLSSVCMECGEFLDNVSDCQLLKEVYVYRIRSCIGLFSVY